MNCYDCLDKGITREAVAVCVSCGVGVCLTCACLESVEHERNGSPGNPLHRVTRTINCPSCDVVLGGRQLSASRSGR